MNQPALFGTYDLFTPRPPAQEASPTSQAAAAAITVTAGTLRSQVLEVIRAAGAHGATDEEIQIALDMNPSTQRPRRIELVRGGYVKDSTTTRKTATGRSAVVWVLSPEKEMA